MDDESAFWRAIEARPDDPIPKFIFADWLDERGDRRCEAFRWAVANDRRPVVVEPGRLVVWKSMMPVEYATWLTTQCGLPHYLCVRMKSDASNLSASGPVFWLFSSADVAWSEFAAAWLACLADGIDPLIGEPVLVAAAGGGV